MLVVAEMENEEMNNANVIKLLEQLFKVQPGLREKLIDSGKS